MAAVTVDPSPAADPGLRGPVDSGFRPCLRGLAVVRAWGWGLGPGLTSDSADAARAVLRDDLIGARDSNRDDQLGATGGCGMLVSPAGR